jgi:hypothetical protein
LKSPRQKWERALAFFDEPPRYYTFLLTVWEERNQDPNSPGVWRFRLEDTRTNHRHGFASLEGVTAFLHNRLDGSQAISTTTKEEGGKQTRKGGG